MRPAMAALKCEVIRNERCKNIPTMIPRRSTPTMFESLSVEGSQVIRRTLSKRLNSRDNVLNETNKITKNVKKPSRLTSFKRHRIISSPQWSQNDVKGNCVFPGNTTDQFFRRPKGIANKKLKNVTKTELVRSKSENPGMELTRVIFENGSVVHAPFTGARNRSIKSYDLKCVCESNVSTELTLNEPVSRSTFENDIPWSITMKTKTKSTYTLKSKTRNLYLKRCGLARNFESCQACSGENQLEPHHKVAETSLVMPPPCSKQQVKQKYRRNSLNLKPFSLFSHHKNMSKAFTSKTDQHNLNISRRQSRAFNILENDVFSDDQEESICLSNYTVQTKKKCGDSESSKINLNSIIDARTNLSNAQNKTKDRIRKSQQIFKPNSFSLHKKGLYIIRQVSSSDIKGTKNLTNYNIRENSNDLTSESSAIKETQLNSDFYQKRLSRKRTLYNMKLERLKADDRISLKRFENYCSNSRYWPKDSQVEISGMELKAACKKGRWISQPCQTVTSKLNSQNNYLTAKSEIDKRFTHLSKNKGRSNVTTSAYYQAYYSHTVGSNKKYAQPTISTKTKPNAVNSFVNDELKENKGSFVNMVKSKMSQVFHRFYNIFSNKKRTYNINKPNSIIHAKSSIKDDREIINIQNMEEFTTTAYNKNRNKSRCEGQFSQYGYNEITTAYCQICHDNKCISDCNNRQIPNKPRPHVIDTFNPFEDGNFIVSPIEKKSGISIEKTKSKLSILLNLFVGNKDNAAKNNLNDPKNKKRAKKSPDEVFLQRKQELIKGDKNKKQNKIPPKVHFLPEEESIKNPKNKKQTKLKHETPLNEELYQNYDSAIDVDENKTGNKKTLKTKKADPKINIKVDTDKMKIKNSEEVLIKAKKKNRDKFPHEEEFPEELEQATTKKSKKKKQNKNPPKENQEMYPDAESELNIKLDKNKMKIKNSEEILEKAKKKKRDETRSGVELLQNEQKLVKRPKKTKQTVLRSEEELPQKSEGLFDISKNLQRQRFITLSGDLLKMAGSQPKNLRCVSCKSLDTKRPKFAPGPTNKKHRHALVQPSSRGDAQILSTVEPKFDIEVDSDMMNIKNREEVLRGAMQLKQTDDLHDLKGKSPCCCKTKRQKCAVCKNLPITSISKPGQLKDKSMKNKQLLEIEMDSDSNILNQADVIQGINKLKSSGTGSRSSVIDKLLSLVDEKRLKKEVGNTALVKLVKYMITRRPVCVCQSDVCSRDAELEYLKKEQMEKGKKVPCVCGSPSCEKLAILRLMNENDLSKSEGRKLLKQLKKAQKVRKKKLKEERKERMMKEQQKIKAKNMKQLRALGSVPVISKDTFSRLSKEQRAALKPLPTVTKKELKAFPKEQQVTIKRQIKRQQKARKLAMQKDAQMRKLADQRQKQAEEDQAAKEQLDDERKARKQKQSFKEKLLQEQLKRKNEAQEAAIAEKEKRIEEKRQKLLKERKIRAKVMKKMRKRKEKIKRKRMLEKKKRKAKIAKKKLKKKMAKMERIRKENKKFLNEMMKARAKERAINMKDEALKEQRRIKRREFMREEIKKYKDAEDRYILGQTLKEAGACCYKYTNKFLGLLSHSARHPTQTYKKIRRAYLDPSEVTKEMQKKWSESEIHEISDRIEAKILALDRLQPLGKRLYDKPKAKKIPKRRFKKRKRKRRAPVDFACSLYMGSLRNKPYFMVYWMCPWFYPHFISILKVLRQVADMGLFILAALVWSPLIILWEFFRTIMCCGLCTA